MTGRVTRLHRLRYVAPAMVLLLLAACTTTIRQHPDFLTRIRAVSEVGMMPPEVTVTRFVFKGDNERLFDEEKAIRGELPELLRRSLAARDFSVKIVELGDALLAEFPDLRFETSQSQMAFATAMNEAYATPEMWKSKARSYRRSLGPRTSRFAEVAGVDTLLFARYTGGERSAGELMKDAMIGAVAGFRPLPEWSVLEVSLVDAATGDILWSNLVTSVDVQEGFAAFRPGSLVEKMTIAAFKEFER